MSLPLISIYSVKGSKLCGYEWIKCGWECLVHIDILISTTMWPWSQCGRNKYDQSHKTNLPTILISIVGRLVLWLWYANYVKFTIMWLWPTMPKANLGQSVALSWKGQGLCKTKHRIIHWQRIIKQWNCGLYTLLW